MNKKIIYAIIPARSGSKGLPNKNIKLLNGIPLIAYSIKFAQALGCDKVICSTDSEEYAAIAIKYGAEVPFLRSDYAANDTAMEEDILRDLALKFEEYKLLIPDVLVWLRPTFVFRDLEVIRRGIDLLVENNDFTAARTVCESESRLYSLKHGVLKPAFDDRGKSMIRRQDIGRFYKVFSTDIIRFNAKSINDDFLGRHVLGLEINKLCGLDIDDAEDFQIIESIIQNNRMLVEKYLFV
ncbi:acylneuraminate cytidylyltransferase family protein [Olivibacter sp. CPCC 100613]|uniref:acylneuraminate cytidylyltransferase family protein n=1 Tax=Olivibacter sp. CPCC 100613 TaxID=3079931 RepID=UPI002FF74F24